MADFSSATPPDGAPDTVIEQKTFDAKTGTTTTFNSGPEGVNFSQSQEDPNKGYDNDGVEENSVGGFFCNPIHPPSSSGDKSDS